ncbi:MAG: glycosyltransferase family 39 protein [Anaerolineae bacterium]|nr:glycosyltransferase family 39 protein [Anaerolineae bacterium]
MMGHTQPAQTKCINRETAAGLVLLLLLYLLVALAHAYLAPLTTGPDELAHYEYLRFIAEHGRLPHTYEEREQASYKSDQPPLYHVLAALPASLIDPAGPPFLKRVIDHPRRQLIERTRHAWGLYNTEDERWPYRAEILRWHIGRWVAILFGAATVALTFFIAREVFARLPAIGEEAFFALGAAAIVAFIPRFALTGSMLNYETTMAFWAALFLWGVLRVQRGRDQGTGGLLYLVVIGVSAGLAILAKLSAIILPLEAVIAFWLIQKYAISNTQCLPCSWQNWLRNSLITLAATGLVVSLWFGFVVYQFNTVAEDGWWIGLLRPLIAADASDATTNRLLSLLTGGEAGFTGAIENLDTGPPWAWLAIFFRTFWVVGIEEHQPLGWLGLVVALFLCTLATYGLVGIWRRNDQRTVPQAQDKPVIADRRSERLTLSLLLLHLIAPVVLPFLRYVVTFSLADTAQGRHVLFMAAPAFATLLGWGLRAGVSRITCHVSRIKADVRLIVFGPGLFLFIWSGVQLWYMTWAYLPLLPVWTGPEAKAQVSSQLNQPMNDYVTLIGYNHQLDEDSQMMRLDLLWQATAVSPFDYLTEVTLLDSQGDAQVQWLGYPANGRYPTRAWDVDDLVRDTVWLPLAGLEAGPYEVRLNLISARLNPPPPPETLTLSPLTLTTVTLPDFSQPPSAESRIWQNGKPLSGPRTFRYRETILVTLAPNPPGEAALQIIGPDDALAFAPVRQLNRTALFIVGPDWPIGAYRLRLTSTTAGQAEYPLINVIDRWERQFTPPPMARVIEANFANQVKLLGYDLGTNRAKPGGGIPLTLYWQGLDWLGDDYTIFTKLLAADQSVHGGRDRLPQEGYRTLYWAPGEIVTDPFGVPVAPDAPDGIYYINVGLYKEVAGQAVSLPLVQDGQPIEASSINIGPIKLGNAPIGLTLARANPQHPLNQPFGDAPNLTLLGYDLESGPEIRNTEYEIRLILYWRSEAPLPVDYTTFVHLRNAANNEVVAQKDQPPLNGAYPTSLWDPGEIIADEIVIPLPAELPGGQYQLVLGMYDFQTGQRLAVSGNPANEVKLLDVEIP